MRRMGKSTLEFDRPPSILSHAAVGGKKEAEGPLGDQFDQTFGDTTLRGQLGKAEAQLQKGSGLHRFEKGGLGAEGFSSWRGIC